MNAATMDLRLMSLDTVHHGSGKTAWPAQSTRTVVTQFHECDLVHAG